MFQNVPCAAALLLSVLTPVGAYAQSTASVSVVNSSSWTIVSMFLSPTAEQTWGPDRLGSSVLSTGGSFTLTDISCSIYDVRLVDEDGDECVVRKVPLCEGSEVWNIDNDSLLSCQAQTGASSASAAASPSSTVVVTNESAWSIHQLYLSPSSQSSWGDDQLGTGTISTGGSFTMHGIPCGQYDVKLIDEDGDACVVSGISLCGEHTTWDITSENLLGCQASSQ